MKTWIKKTLIGLIVATIIGSGGWYGSNVFYDYAHKQGMKTYHGICFHIGGTLVDKEDGTVVQCMPLAIIPPSELEQLNQPEKNSQEPLDNKNKVVYNT